MQVFTSVLFVSWHWIVLFIKNKTIKKKLKRVYNYHIGNFTNFSFKPILLFLTL